MIKYYIYIIKAGNYSKIGVTRNVEKRLKTLQTGCPYLIKLLCSIQFDTKKEAYEKERILHQANKKYHFRGEWFHGDIDMQQTTVKIEKMKPPKKERKEKIPPLP